MTPYIKCFAKIGDKEGFEPVKTRRLVINFSYKHILVRLSCKEVSEHSKKSPVRKEEMKKGKIRIKQVHSTMKYFGSKNRTPYSPDNITRLKKIFIKRAIPEGSGPIKLCAAIIPPAIDTDSPIKIVFK